MNREYLLNRLATLEDGKAKNLQMRDQCHANLNSFLGAIEEINLQLLKLDEEEKDKVPPPGVPVSDDVPMQMDAA